MRFGLSVPVAFAASLALLSSTFVGLAPSASAASPVPASLSAGEDNGDSPSLNDEAPGTGGIGGLGDGSATTGFTCHQGVMFYKTNYYSSGRNFNCNPPAIRQASDPYGSGASAHGYPTVNFNSPPEGRAGYSYISYKSCPVGYQVFRFYGTLADPTAVVASARVNIPNPAQKCTQNYDKQLINPDLTAFLASSPSDIYANANSDPVSPWGVLDAVETNDMRNYHLLGISDTTKFNYQIWRTAGSGQFSHPTSGETISLSGNCAKYSSPAIHQSAGFEEYTLPTLRPQNGVEYTSNRLVSTDYSAAKMPGGSTGGYIEVMNTWLNGYTKDSSKEMTAAIAGLPLSSSPKVRNPLTAANIGSAASAYQPCGSPVNFQVKVSEVVSTYKDSLAPGAKEGYPSVLKLPANNEYPVNAMAYVVIAKVMTLQRSGNGTEAYMMHASSRPQWTKEYYSTVGGKKTYKVPRILGSYKPGGSFGSRPAASVLKDEYRAAVKSWFQKYKSGGFPKAQPGDGTLPEFMLTTRDLNGQQSVPINAQTLADSASIQIMDQSVAFAVGDSCVPGGTRPVDVPCSPVPPDPGPRLIDEPEDFPRVVDPALPCNLGESSCPFPGESFKWTLNANPRSYLEVRSGMANSRISFTATPVAVWKTQEQAEDYIDAIAKPLMDTAYAQALLNRENWIDTKVKPVITDIYDADAGSGKWVSATRRDARGANFDGHDWDIVITYKGVGIDTWLPQCDSESPTVNCDPAKTTPDQQPVVNAQCIVVGCVTDSDVSRKSVLARSATLRSPTYATGQPWTLGEWVYDFYSASTKGQVVRVAHDPSGGVDVNVAYDAANHDKVSWYVNLDYVPWVWVPPVMAEREVDALCKVEASWEFPRPGTGIWVPFVPKKYINEPCKKMETYVKEKGYWKHGNLSTRNQGGSYTSWTLPDAQSYAVTVNNRSMNGPGGGAGCDLIGQQNVWNYCSPVLAGKAVATSAGRTYQTVVTCPDGYADTGTVCRRTIPYTYDSGSITRPYEYDTVTGASRPYTFTDSTDVRPYSYESGSGPKEYTYSTVVSTKPYEYEARVGEMDYTYTTKITQRVPTTHVETTAYTTHPVTTQVWVPPSSRQVLQYVQHTSGTAPSHYDYGQGRWVEDSCAAAGRGWNGGDGNCYTGGNEWVTEQIPGYYANSTTYVKDPTPPGYTDNGSAWVRTVTDATPANCTASGGLWYCSTSVRDAIPDGYTDNGTKWVLDSRVKLPTPEGYTDDGTRWVKTSTVKDATPPGYIDDGTRWVPLDGVKSPTPEGYTDNGSEWVKTVSLKDPTPAGFVDTGSMWVEQSKVVRPAPPGYYDTGTNYALVAATKPYDTSEMAIPAPTGGYDSCWGETCAGSQYVNHGTDWSGTTCPYGGTMHDGQCLGWTEVKWWNPNKYPATPPAGYVVVGSKWVKTIKDPVPAGYVDGGTMWVRASSKDPIPPGYYDNGTAWVRDAPRVVSVQ